MKTIRKILILCDAHDFIRYETSNVLLLKQLYVTVFLLKNVFCIDEAAIHIINRTFIGFDIFWKNKSKIRSFLTPYTNNKTWSSIDMLNYDLIVCHPEYQKDLKKYTLKAFGKKNRLNIYSLSEIQYPCDLIYPSIGSLFVKGGALELKRTQTNGELLRGFKRELDQSFTKLTARKQESKIPKLANLVNTFNSRLNLDKINEILILDDYYRGAFIGDSLFWLKKVKMLIDTFPGYCNFTIIISNPSAFKIIDTAYNDSLPEQISILNLKWEQISFEDYDLILCNNDVLLKVYWYLKLAFPKIDRTPFYSFTAMSNRQISRKPTLDFFTNLYYNGYSDKLDAAKSNELRNVYGEISLTRDERLWSNRWLKNNGLVDSDRLIVLVHDSSSSQKVISDIELLTFIRFLMGSDDSVKILLICERKLSADKWQNGVLNSDMYRNVILGEALELRKVMSLLGNRKVVAVIGPCTGLMHLADGIYTCLINRRVIPKSQCPLLLTYCGKQEPERSYHPASWWIDAKVAFCCVCMKEERGIGLKLIPLKDCPPDYKTFFIQSASARNISSTMLAEFIFNELPEFFNSLREPKVTDQLSEKRKLPKSYSKVYN